MLKLSISWQIVFSEAWWVEMKEEYTESSKSSFQKICIYRIEGVSTFSLCNMKISEVEGNGKMDECLKNRENIQQ